MTPLNSSATESAGCKTTGEFSVPFVTSSPKHGWHLSHIWVMTRVIFFYIVFYGPQSHRTTFVSRLLLLARYVPNVAKEELWDHCCKGDERFQWEMLFFGVWQLQNLLTDFQKILHSWLCPRPHPTCKYWGQSVQRGRVCACVKLSPSGVYFFSFFRSHAHRYRSARWTDQRH